jgi:small-conductance mechanosensitive channel/CRP-like cAMP-binding protein
MDSKAPTATTATDKSGSDRSDVAWLRWAVLLNMGLAALSVMRRGTLAAFEHLPPPQQAESIDLVLAFAQFPALAWLLMRLFKFGMDKAGFRRFPNIARHLLGVLVHVILLALAIRVVFDQSLDTVVAASGVITVVLGFALRSLVADLFSGIALSVDRDFGVDDIVEFTLKNRHVIGHITEFNWRTFKVRDLNSQVIMIPNSEFASLMVINHSRSESGCPCTVRFPLPARCDGEKALRVLRGVLSRGVQEGRVAATPSPNVQLAAATPGSLNFEAHFLPQAPHTEDSVVGSLYEGGLRDLKLAGLSLAGGGDLSAPSSAGGLAPGESGQLSSPLVLALGRVALLSVLSDAQRAQLVTYLARHDEAEGSVIVDEGQDGSSMYIILEGSCAVHVRSGETWREVARLWPGDHFGEMSLLTGKPRSARVRMLSDGVLLELPKAALSELFAATPELLAKVSACVVARAEESDAIRKLEDHLAQQQSRATRVEVLVLQMRRFFGFKAG